MFNSIFRGKKKLHLFLLGVYRLVGLFFRFLEEFCKSILGCSKLLSRGLGTRDLHPERSKIHLIACYLWWFRKSGKLQLMLVNIPLFIGFSTSQVVVWDFWTINSILGRWHLTSLPGLFFHFVEGLEGVTRIKERWRSWIKLYNFCIQRTYLKQSHLFFGDTWDCCIVCCPQQNGHGNLFNGKSWDFRGSSHSNHRSVHRFQYQSNSGTSNFQWLNVEKSFLRMCCRVAPTIQVGLMNQDWVEPQKFVQPLLIITRTVHQRLLGTTGALVLLNAYFSG